MTVVKTPPRIVRKSVDEEIRRLETFVRRMESRYERDSAEAVRAVASGRMKETAEVSRWLTSYNVLMSLSVDRGHGSGTGSPMTNTRVSIKAAWNRLRAKG